MKSRSHTTQTLRFSTKEHLNSYSNIFITFPSLLLLKPICPLLIIMRNPNHDKRQYKDNNPRESQEQNLAIRLSQISARFCKFVFSVAVVFCLNGYFGRSLDEVEGFEKLLLGDVKAVAEDKGDFHFKYLLVVAFRLVWSIKVRSKD